jgi:uncharacterized protein YbjQ (UPF0145 family)
MEQFLILIILICLGYIGGTIAEMRHYRSIITREKQFLKLPTVTINRIIEKDVEIKSVEMVQGSAVISVDYFKRILAALRNFFGGEVKSYESLVDRARREATLRMKEKALNADIILNTRIETATIGRNANRRNSIGSIEAIAYGTSITYRK